MIERVADPSIRTPGQQAYEIGRLTFAVLDIHAPRSLSLQCVRDRTTEEPVNNSPEIIAAPAVSIDSGEDITLRKYTAGIRDDYIGIPIYELHQNGTNIARAHEDGVLSHYGIALADTVPSTDQDLLDVYKQVAARLVERLIDNREGLSPDAYLHYGMLFLRKGNTDQALSCLELAQSGYLAEGYLLGFEEASRLLSTAAEEAGYHGVAQSAHMNTRRII